MAANDKDSPVEHIDTKESEAVDPKGIWPPIDETWLQREKKLVRRLDMTLMPMVWTLYLFNYLDRNNIAQAKLDTFEEDLGLKGNQFNVAVSILNVGYMLMQLPSNMIITRVRPSLYIPFWASVWSVVSACTAATHSFGGLMAVRFVLGICEAPFFPGVYYVLSCWYTKKELALRVAVLYSGLVLATAVSGLLAAGIFAGLSDVRGLAGWQWLFLLEGVASFVAAAVALFVLPDYPESETGSGRWLFTEEERRFAVERIIRQQVSEDHDSDHSVWHGLKLACKDFRMWVFAFILCSNHSAYGFNNFYPSIVKGFNLGSQTVTLLCTAPPYLFGAAVSLIVASTSDRFGERGFHIAVPMAVAAIGFIINVSTLAIAPRYFASFLYIPGCFAANAILFTWIANVLSKTPQKRACATAIINVMSQLGNVWSPYFFDPEEEPRYTKAMVLMIAFSVASMLAASAMKWVLRRDNKKIVAQYQGTGITPKLYTS